MRRKLKGLTVLSVAALLMVVAMPAHASLIVVVQGFNNGSSVLGGISCLDNGACDSNLAIGQISWNNVAGVNLNISTESASSGSPVAAISTTLNGTPVNLGTLTVAISDNGFLMPPTPLTLTQNVSGTAATSGGSTMTMVANGFLSFSNTVLVTNGPTTGPTPTAVQNGPSESASAAVGAGGTPYSLTEFITVNITSIGSGTNKNLQVNADLSAEATAVPEPVSMALVGGTLLLVGAISRRKLYA